MRRKTKIRLLKYLKIAIVLTVGIAFWLIITTRHRQRVLEEHKVYTIEELEAQEELVKMTNEMINNFE